MGEIARATGQPVHYEPITIDAYASSLAEQGTPDEYVTLLTYLFAEVLDGRNASLTDDIERVLGRKPTDFADYARRTAATGIWSNP